MNIVQVALGNVDGTFEAPVAFAVGENPRSVRVGDVNLDQKADLLVAGVRNDVSVLLGIGDGTFASATSVSIGVLPNAIQLADVDAMNGPDILVIDDSFGETELRVLLADGNGGFGSPTVFDLGVTGFARSLAVADFNNDQRLDVAAAGTSLAVALGNGDGSFQDSTRVLGIGGTVVTGFVDGNIEVDLMLDNFGSRISVILGVGDGTFGTEIATDTVGGLGFVSGDFDGDGNWDVATLAEEGPASGPLTSAAVMLGVGDGTFESMVRLPVGGAPDRFVAGDANGDGQLDLILSGDSLDADGQVAILFGRGDGTFRSQIRKNAGADPSQPGGQVTRTLGR